MLSGADGERPEPMTSISSPATALLDTSQSPACLRLAGDWTLASYASLKHSIARLQGLSLIHI